MVVRVVAEVALDLLRGRLQQVSGTEARHRAEEVREDGDADELFEQGEPGRLAGDLPRGEEADAGQQPRLARLPDGPVDGRRDDERRNQSSEAREKGREDAERQPDPVPPRVRQQVHHRVPVDVVADVLEPAVFVCHRSPYRIRREVSRDSTRIDAAVAGRLETSAPKSGERRYAMRS